MNKKVDPRIQGIPQDAVHKDQGRMTQIEELVDKLRIEYQTESIIADLVKKGKSNKLSDESRRTLQKIGNIDLYELGKCPRPFNVERRNREKELQFNLRVFLFHTTS